MLQEVLARSGLREVGEEGNVQRTAVTTKMEASRPWSAQRGPRRVF